MLDREKHSIYNMIVNKYHILSTLRLCCDRFLGAAEREEAYEMSVLRERKHKGN